MNAREEFEETVKDVEVICAYVGKFNSHYDEKIIAELVKGYSEKDYKEFLKKIDFEYDDGYGSEELSGTIWCQDGIWFDRGEYDGSEWWERHKYPKFPEE